MKMTNQKRVRGLLSLGIAVVAIVILSAGLSEVELLPGQPFSVESESEDETGGFGPLPSGQGLITLLRALIFFTLLLLPVAVVYAIISPEFRKRVLRRLLSLLVFAVLAYWVAQRLPELFNMEEEATFSGGQPLTEAPLTAPPVQFVADPPAWLVLATSLALALLVSAILVGVVWFLRHRAERPVGSLEQLAHEAEEALELLRAGGDIKDTVMRCYAEMSRTLDRERGIVRLGSMTPREFEGRLAGMGLPGEPVRQLTRLFEQVRYGAKVADEREEELALICLTDIVEACRSL
jgi:hypothetical protein